MPPPRLLSTRYRRVGAVAGTPLKGNCYQFGISRPTAHRYEGNHPFLEYPRVMGHELAVEIVYPSESPELNASEVCVVNPYIVCGQCVACQNGKPNCCGRIAVLGVHRDSVMTGLLAVPADNVAQRAAAAKVVKDIRRATRKQHSAEEKTGSCWPGRAARTASPSAAGARGSRRASIAAGRRSSWKPASGAWRATLHGRRAVPNEGSAHRGGGAEGGGGRSHAGEPAAQEKHDRGSRDRLCRCAGPWLPATTFYRWYDRYRAHGPEGLEDRCPRPGRVWNRIPEPVREWSSGCYLPQ